MTPARETALWADTLARRLLVASSTFATHPERLEAMKLALHDAWPGLRDRMAQLEQTVGARG